MLNAKKGGPLYFDLKSYGGKRKEEEFLFIYKIQLYLDRGKVYRGDLKIG